MRQPAHPARTAARSSANVDEPKAIRRRQLPQRPDIALGPTSMCWRLHRNHAVQVRQPAHLLLLHPRRQPALEPANGGPRLRRPMQLASPLPRPPVERRRQLRRDPTAKRTRTSLTGRMRTEPPIPRVQVGPGAVTENITDSCSCSRLTNRRRRVSRAQVGANSGQMRDEQRRTSSGIGRPHVHRCHRHPRRIGDAIAACAGSLAGSHRATAPDAHPAGAHTATQSSRSCPRSVQPQSETVRCTCRGHVRLAPRGVGFLWRWASRAVFR